MKVELKKDGYIHVIAETVVEGFALRAILPPENEVCDKCKSVKMPVVFEAGILLEEIRSK